MDEKILMQCIAIRRKDIRTANSNRVFYDSIPREEMFKYHTQGETSPLIEEWLERCNYSDKISDEFASFDLETRTKADKVINARKQKAKRVRKRIEEIMKGDCLFLTFTFRPETLQTTTFEYRKRYIRDWLLNLHCLYVGNLDYGKKNGREHYHAVVGISSVDFGSYSLGTLKGLKIKSGSSSIALSRYIVKLTSHCLKNTARTIIYSRTKK